MVGGRQPTWRRLQKRRSRRAWDRIWPSVRGTRWAAKRDFPLFDRSAGRHCGCRARRTADERELPSGHADHAPDAPPRDDDALLIHCLSWRGSGPPSSIRSLGSRVSGENSIVSTEQNHRECEWSVDPSGNRRTPCSSSGSSD